MKYTLVLTAGLDFDNEDEAIEFMRPCRETFEPIFFDMARRMGRQATISLVPEPGNEISVLDFVRDACGPIIHHES